MFLLFSENMQESEEKIKSSSELNVSFGYHCSACQESPMELKCKPQPFSGIQFEESTSMVRSSSFSCLSGAALSANATLANTNICNGIIGEEILPSLDSPKSFRRMASSPSLSRLDLPSASSYSSISSLGGSGSALNDNDLLDTSNHWKPMSAPTRFESSSFLTAIDTQMAGGAAGEDRVQAVCSEENGWLFCGIYDGFNGRDAADFLAGTLYDNLGFYLHLLECRIRQQKQCKSNQKDVLNSTQCGGTIKSGLSLAMSTSNVDSKPTLFLSSSERESLGESFCDGVLDCLTQSLAQAERDFLYMVEQDMDDRPDLVSIGSCLLVVLLHGMDLYVMNLGDSRAVLATITNDESKMLVTQLTEVHTVDNELECKKILADHPDDPSAIIGGRVKGKLKVTRAFGVGYLKQRNLNDALMGILQVRNLCSPPYVYNDPYTMRHRVTENDLFVVLGSDGLFDFFTNNEVVSLVHQFIQKNPFGDPAKHLVEHLILRAAKNAGFNTEELLRVPAGRRRKYHDDVTVIVIILGNKQRTSTATTTSL